jgi:hypothetical protein
MHLAGIVRARRLSPTKVLSAQVVQLDLSMSDLIRLLRGGHLIATVTLEGQSRDVFLRKSSPFMTRRLLQFSDPGGPPSS